MSLSFAIPGSPALEHNRSRAAQRVARLANKSGLFFTNFEHRARLKLPPAWLPESAEEPLGEFVGGVLPEPKYQSFRHDLLIGSFHPCHRAQWTAHELCHGLVGFAYRPGATTLFHALAAWLAELLPVTLWYFYDEADATKCQAHTGTGPLFQQHCDDCERAAHRGPRPFDRRAEQRVRDGQRFLARELSAIRKSRKRGRPEGTRFATIDLAQDALTYAASHRRRLNAPEMERYAAQFFGPGQGLHDSLEGLEARVQELSEYLCGDRKARPWRATAWDYAAQDVGYRLLTLRAGAREDLTRELDGLIDALAGDRSEAGMDRCIQGYRALHEALGARRGRAALPSVNQLFAVGYPLRDGLGHATEQIAQGIASACPSTWQALGREARSWAQAFCEADVAVRSPIGRRFAKFLTAELGGPIAELCRVEAAITHVAPRDLISTSLDPREARDQRYELARGVELIRLEHEVLNTPPQRVRRAPKRSAPYTLLVVRSDTGAVDIAELDNATASLIANAPADGLMRDGSTMDATTFAQLLELGVLIPKAYAE